MAAKANRCNKKESIAISAIQLYPNIYIMITCSS